MRYLITAYDSKEEGTFERRMSVRQDHLANVLSVKEYGSVICVGGLPDEDGKLIGSYLVMDFESRELLDRYLESEPYLINDVWKDVSIVPCYVTIKDDEFVGK